MFLLSACMLFSINQNSVSAFSEQIIQKGATGNDVVELQARLQYNGYYHARIDGVYGWSTYWAVKNFQQEFGLDHVDGLVGPKTKEMLHKATKFNKEWVHQQINSGKKFTHYGGMELKYQVEPSPATVEKAKQGATNQWAKQKTQYQKQTPAPQKDQAKPAPSQQQPAPGQQQEQPAPEQQPAPVQEQPAPAPEEQAAPEDQPAEDEGEAQSATNMPGGFSENDIQLMANAVYGEARGEPYEGQIAVAAVILNRINSPTFPNTVSGVIFEPLAFTAVADGQIWLTPNETAKRAVIDAINGMDPSEGATYYFNPNTATSGWIWGRPQIKRIGKHIFCD
ncbi:spore cortex-lytic enzyme [Sutcliffiella horikoshii]|uniref:spore cortex-lytic enzyme n=1 Tax=Sutcliffiella horikoshii TaxID=79883 RepID=UPI001CFDAD6E|nr:spore cortex-lytic enzyme [Sutcliffiella horikoshii]